MISPRPMIAPQPIRSPTVTRGIPLTLIRPIPTSYGLVMEINRMMSVAGTSAMAKNHATSSTLRMRWETTLARTSKMVLMVTSGRWNEVSFRDHGSLITPTVSSSKR